MIVFLECGAAAGGVGDDGIEIFVGEGREICPGKIARGIADTGVSGQRSATKLILGDDDFAAVRGEHADGGFIEIRKYDIGDATGEEGDTGAARAGCWIGFTQTAKEKIIVDPRQEAFLLGDAEKFQDADAAGNGLQAGALIEAEETGGVDDEMRGRQQVAEDVIAHDAGQGGTLVAALDAGASIFDKLAVFDAGRAGGSGRAANRLRDSTSGTWGKRSGRGRNERSGRSPHRQASGRGWGAWAWCGSVRRNDDKAAGAGSEVPRRLFQVTRDPGKVGTGRWQVATKGDSFRQGRNLRSLRSQ